MWHFKYAFFVFKKLADARKSIKKEYLNVLILV